MIRPSKKATEKSTESLKAKYIKDGVIDTSAVRADAKALAAKLWSGYHVVYSSQEEMEDGFYKDTLKRISQ